MFGRLLVRTCAGLVASAGLAALGGWLLGLPSLASLGSSTIPVAPSTAVLFVLYAAALWLRVPPERRGASRAAPWIVAVAGLVALPLLILAWTGKYLEVEHLGVAIDHPAGQTPIGHMSPVTALAFLLAAASFLSSLSSAPEWGRRGVAAWWLASLLVTLGFALLLGYLLGAPFFYGGPLIPPAGLTSAAFLALGVALLALSAPPVRPSLDPAQGPARGPNLLVLIFVVLAAGIGSAGVLFQRRYEARHRLEVERQLSAIAELKTRELADWRAERLADGTVFADNAAFASLVRRSLASPAERQAETRLRAWLSSMQAGSAYDRVSLLDARGVERLSRPETPELVGAVLRRKAAESLRSPGVAFLDFHRDEPGRRILLTVLAPVFDESFPPRALGVVALRIDPERYLFPFLSRWPVPSASAETLLVRRDGNDALFLNPLRFRPDAALSLRVSLANTDVPAVQAALGKEGVVEGRDYRGVPVVAAVRAVPGSPWFLVARMDLAEVFAPARERLFATLLVMGLLLASAAAGTSALWQRQRRLAQEALLDRERRLRESEQRYRRVLDGMMEGFQIIGDDWRYLYLNDTAAAYGRRKKEDLLGRTVMESYPGIERTPLFAAMQSCREDRRPRRIEEEFRYPDGSTAWFGLGIQPAPEGIVVVSLDITDRKRAEEELSRLNAELEERVRLRTAELQAAVKELETFAFSVSHDLKAPLRAIDGYSRLLLEEHASALDEEGQRCLHNVRRSAGTMNDLISDLLAYSRLERRALHSEQLDLASLVRGVVAERTEEIQACGAEVRLELPDAAVRADRDGLGIAMRNLLGNALKFSRPLRPPVIEIGASVEERSCRLWVRDNGIGFDMKYHDRIFEIFQRLGRSEDYEGTGVGLALVRKAVERMGGRAWAESAPGRGATFFLELPR